MPIPLSELLTGGLLPALTSLLVWLAWGKWIDRESTREEDGLRPWKSPLCLTVGFLVGYGLLGLAPWIPESHWHWLVFALLWVALTMPTVTRWLPHNSGHTHWLRLAISALIFLPAFYLLTPTWDLSLAKPAYLGLVVVLACCVSFSLNVQMNRASQTEPDGPSPAMPIVSGDSKEKPVGNLLAIVSAAVLFAVIIQTFLSGSLLFTQLAMLGASCFAGLLGRRDFRNELWQCRAWFAMFVVGILFIAEVNSFSSVPSWTYLMIAITPFVSNCLLRVTRGRLSFPWQLALSISLLCLALAWAGVAEFSGGSEY